MTIDPETTGRLPELRDSRPARRPLQLNTAGYPDDATLALARHASVSTYMKKVTVPTLLVQGQKDTLFNLQEAVATYKCAAGAGHPDQDGLAVLGSLRLHAGAR